MIRISVLSFSNLTSVKTMAVKSGDFEFGAGGGVCVAMRVYAGISGLAREMSVEEYLLNG